MGWKSERQLLDLDPGLRIEFNCEPGGCGSAAKPTVEEVIRKFAARGVEEPQQLYLDQVEARLTCRNCRRRMVILNVDEDQAEAFQGGMP